MTDLPPLPPSSPGVRLRYRLVASVEVDHPDGRPFYRGRVESVTYDQGRAGVVALNQTVVDMLQAQADLGRLAAECHDRPRPIPSVVLAVGPPREQQGGPPGPTPSLQSQVRGPVLMSVQLGSSQEFDLSVRFADRRGNTARVDGIPEWMTDNSEVLSLRPSEDGLSCTVRAVGPLGRASVTLSADADLGEGSTPIVGTVEIEVTVGSATAVELVPGDPREQTFEDLPEDDLTAE